MNVIEYLKSTNTKEKVIQLIKDNLCLYQGINTEEKIELFTGSLYNMFVNECVQNNQYISLSNKSIDQVNLQYRFLINKLKNLHNNNLNEQIHIVVENHRNALIQIINANEYNESVEQLIIPCFEYTNKFQESILRLDKSKLMEPIIDIGCGKDCSLVKILKNKGYKEVFGIDQYFSGEDYIISSNWFDFEFKHDTYGTIISHMAFSNHYKRTLVLHDGKGNLYKNKYNEILRALKISGKFIYTPALAFEEQRIDTNKYSISRYSNMADKELDTVIITRL